MTVMIMIMAMVSQDMSDSVAQLAFKTWANLGICVCVCVCEVSTIIIIIITAITI